MLIEYKIKFEKDGLTISHRIEPNSPSAQIASPRVIALGAPATAATSNPIATDPASGPNPPSQDTSSGPNPPSQDTSSGPNPPSEDTSSGSVTQSSGVVAPAPIFVLGPITFNNPTQASTVQPQQPQPPNDQPPKTYRAKATS